MSLCLACITVNHSNANFCAKCGARLLIQDRYRAFKVIGQGVFGKTLLAQDEGKPSKPKCVIKQFTYTGVGMQKASELFQQEVEQLEKLGKHAQIPELLAHTEQEGRQYLVQEFIDGQNIAQELREQGAFNETKIREFLLEPI
ncbi:protein kinase family protein [Synechococcus sp. PCC 7502]|uniref:inactive serine/threonine-protein kinase VRK3 n=1 Tax=Synechococcus sp. PCC 7502 TaxID=1173263 RepID=UPI00029FAA84|nr:inactive serine/threonine-protein kinase VRK3 [Synechococcus sp. PCC 7502]AFY72835.1 protein kinase family protein [Synechococcus sp. PCC 7502]